MKIFATFFLVIGQLLSSSSAQTVICPDSSVISPCVCGDNGDGTVSLNCFARNVNDVRVSTILDSFLSAGITPLGYLNLGYNPMTEIPSKIPSFKQLFTVGLGSNELTIIKSKSFDFNVPLDLLDLRINSISTIEPGAFQGKYANSSYIYLNGNNFTRFEAAVFQPVMEKIIAAGGGYPTHGYIWIKNNPIDCTSDPCHLAWLIRYNRHLLPAVFDGVCIDGTAFEDLQESAYANCPNQFVCPDANGNYANPDSCNSFYTCIDSNPYLTQCPVDGATGEQLVYNPALGRCDKPANVPSCNTGK